MFYNSSGDYNDCVSHGACSLSPDISSLQEIMLSLIKETVYYLLLLPKYIENKSGIIDNIIYLLAFSDCLKDMTEKQVITLLYEQYSNFSKCRKKYKLYCKTNNIKPKELKKFVKLSSKMKLSDILKLGDKEFKYKYKTINEDKKHLEEIFVFVLKSIAVNTVIMQDFIDIDNKLVSKLLTGINLLNKSNISAKLLKSYIDEYAKFNVDILSEINQIRTENFGKISCVNVSCSTEPNKAIMVSGTNLNDLDKLLKSAKDYDIDIYTNGNLLIAHSFPYFKQYLNLKGHFGNALKNTMLDFATFPGAILLTKNESQNIEYLYRGRLFTTDKIVPKGVSQIKNDDYMPIIKSAIQSKGFSKGQIRPSKIVGYNYDNIDSEIDKLIKNGAKKIYVVGLSDLNNESLTYLKKFFNDLPDDECAISLSYNPNKKNVLYTNVVYDYPLTLNLIKIILKKFELNYDKLHFIFTKCDINSLTGMIYLKNIGINNISLSSCSPMFINPAVLKIFRKIYKIKICK